MYICGPYICLTCKQWSSEKLLYSLDWIMKLGCYKVRVIFAKFETLLFTLNKFGRSSRNRSLVNISPDMGAYNRTFSLALCFQIRCLRDSGCLILWYPPLYSRNPQGGPHSSILAKGIPHKMFGGFGRLWGTCCGMATLNAPFFKS